MIPEIAMHCGSSIHGVRKYSMFIEGYQYKIVCLCCFIVVEATLKLEVLFVCISLGESSRSAG